jgi:hypothetical protein
MAFKYKILLATHGYSLSQMDDLSVILDNEFSSKFNPDLDKVNKIEEYFGQKNFAPNPQDQN